jgi:phage shock protein PspC (stress-responsive transcriptional regulator)
MTNPPADQPPGTDGPAGARPAEPPAVEPPASEPAPTQPATAGPETSEPAATEPVAAEPVADQAATPEPVATGPSTAERPAVEYPAAGEPPVVESPAGEPPTADRVDQAPPPAAGFPPPPPPSGVPGSFAQRYGLVRPVQGRYIAGVCGAIGRATNTDPVLWRVLLAVLAFVGGAGLIIYILGWLLTPQEGDSASPVEALLGRGKSSTSALRTILLGAVAVIAMIVIAANHLPSALLVAALIIAGAVLVSRNDRPGWPASAGPSAAPGYPGGGSLSYPPANYPATYPPASYPPAGYAPAGYPPASYPASSYSQASSSPTSPPSAGYPPSDYPPASYATAGYPPPGGYPAQPATGTGTTAEVRPPFAPHGPYATAPVLPPVLPPAPPPRPKPPRSRLGRVTFFIAVLATGVLAAIDLTGGADIPLPAYAAVALATIGLGLIVGTWFGRARWLIALGLVASLALAVTTVADSVHGIRGGVGEARWAPGPDEPLQPRYELAIGDATLDLTGYDFAATGPVTIVVRQGIGSLQVLLPADVDTAIAFDVRAGQIEAFGQQWDASANNHLKINDNGADGVGGGQLNLMIELKLGDVRVTR